MFKLFSTLLVILKYLPKQIHIKLSLLLFTMFVSAIIEIIGAASLVLFSCVVTDPKNSLSSVYTYQLTRYLGTQLPSNTMELLLLVCLLVAIVSIINNLLKAVIIYFSGSYGAYIAGYFGELLLEKFLYLPYQWHLSKNSADLNLAVTWRQNVNTYIFSFLNIVSDFFIICGLLISSFAIAPIVSISIFFVISFFMFFIFKIIGRFIEKTGKRVKDYKKIINKEIQMALHGIKDVKVYNLQSIFLKKYRDRAYEEVWIEALQLTLSNIPSFLIEVIAVLMLSSSVYILYVLISSSAMQSTGILSLLAVSAWRILPAVRRMMSRLAQIKTNEIFVKNVLFYLKIAENLNAINNVSSNKKINFNNKIILKDINFTYDNSNDSALKNISFEIHRGNTIGIIGISGSGKSTLADIIIGLLKPSSGKIIIDSTTLSDDNRINWINKIGYVPQFPYLADGTIAENIAFGSHQEVVNRNQILNCCRMAAMNDFISELEDGIDTLIGERGVKLSGGEIQRIAIARALYHEPEILIFDEATSSLDSKNEKKILQTIYNCKGERTLLIIAHRLSTLEDCDFILWIDKGSIKEIGYPNVIIEKYKKCIKLDSPFQ